MGKGLRPPLEASPLQKSLTRDTAGPGRRSCGLTGWTRLQTRQGIEQVSREGTEDHEGPGLYHLPLIRSFSQPDLRHGPGESGLSPPPPLRYLGVRRWFRAASSQTSWAPIWLGSPLTVSPQHPTPNPWWPSEPLPLGTRQPPPYMPQRTRHMAGRAGLTGLWPQVTVLVSSDGCQTPSLLSRANSSQNPVSRNLWPSSALRPPL